MPAAPETRVKGDGCSLVGKATAEDRRVKKIGRWLFIAAREAVKLGAYHGRATGRGGGLRCAGSRV